MTQKFNLFLSTNKWYKIYNYHFSFILSLSLDGLQYLTEKKIPKWNQFECIRIVDIRCDKIETSIRFSFVVNYW